MTLKENIEAKIKKAMLAREKDTLRALRAIKSQILLAESEKGAPTQLTPEKELNLLMKAAKQRKESIEIYEQQNRQDLLEIEQAELKVIETFLPTQLSDEELKEKVAVIIEKTGATTPKDMGKVMGMASKELSGGADGKRISTMVKSLLAG
jgi:uncharacterized protein YqeY